MDNISISNPGEQLQLLLKKLYPFEPEGQLSVLIHLDNALMADGELLKLTYNSCINHMIRRLITAAAFIKRRYDTDSFPSGTYILEIRRYLRDFTRIPSRETEKILTLLTECLRERDGSPTQTTLARLRKSSRDRGLYCYICGGEMDYEKAKEYNSFEGEHRWPKAMGGKNGEGNLFGCCVRCNRLKKSSMDASDFHYEEISLVSDFDDTNFSTEFEWTYRIAVLARNEYRCVTCGKDAQIVGELYFARRETSDSWHFLNINTYCAKHLPHDR